MKVDKVFEVLKGLVQKAKSLSRMQAVAAVTAAAVAVGGVGTGGYFIYENGHQSQETVADAAPGTETGEVESEETEDIIIAEVVVVADDTEAAEAEETVLTLVATSLEKDLKIKIQDQNSRLVTGAAFVVEVAKDKNGAKATSYEDDDKDGIIYIDDIEAGSYKVVLEEIEGYTIKTGSITVTVKDTLEYKQVDVTAEIKSESEINTAVEDTAVNNIPVEAVLTDTLPLLDSTVTTTQVDKSQVSTSNFTAPSASGANSRTFPEDAASISLTGASVQRNSIRLVTTETPDDSEEEEADSEDTETTKPDPTTPETETPEGGDSKDTETTEPDTTTPETETPEGDGGGSTENGGEDSGNTVNWAKVTLPQKVTMYFGGTTTYTVTPVIEGNPAVIKNIEWSPCTSDAFHVEKGSGNSAVITFAGSGSSNTGNIAAIITYVDSSGKEWTDKSLQFTVTITQMTDSTTPLKDQSGNILYLDSSATKQATLKDYAAQSVFYTAPKYTGWQTRDGKVYYYDANHNAVTGNQVIGGVAYTFNADGSLSQSSGSRGIDVSKYQGSIDWGAVAASGISFAIIRVGYRGASTGVLVEDPYFKSNIAGATRAGIKVGVYFFTQAVTEAEAVEEASMVLSLISGYRVSYPVFIDTESATNGRANGLDTATRTAVVRAFCQTIANGGYKPGVYASKNWYSTRLNASALNSYCIWVAQYNTSCTYSGKYDMWQYTSTGSVPGINGNVDMDISYMNY